MSQPMIPSLLRRPLATLSAPVAAGAVALFLCACSGDGTTGPVTPPPAAAGSLNGVWAGAETWGTTASAGWSVTVTQSASAPTALLGTAVAALDPPNWTMNGVVLDSTHVDMNFNSTGRTGRTQTATLVLSADGRTLSGSITPSPVSSLPATLTLTKQ